MNAFELLGIDGGNPLGFLASLGMLRAVTVKDPRCQMSWRRDAAPPRPTLHTALDEDGVADAVLAEAAIASEIVEELGSSHIKATKPDVYHKVACKWLTQDHSLPGMSSPTDYFAAFTCDALATIGKEGKPTKNGEANDQGNGKALPPSRLSFSNGASNQWLFTALRDLVGRLRQPPAPPRPRRNAKASANTPPALSGRDLIIENLFHNEGHVVTQNVQSMNWSPQSWRSYALRWTDPGSKKDNEPVDVPLNVCAFLGFAALSSAPVGNRLKTCGFALEDGVFYWRLPQSPVKYAEAVSVVATVAADLHLPGAMAWKSKRINPDGKGYRYYFTPGECLS